MYKKNLILYFKRCLLVIISLFLTLSFSAHATSSIIDESAMTDEELMSYYRETYQITPDMFSDMVHEYMAENGVEFLLTIAEMFIPFLFFIFIVAKIMSTIKKHTKNYKKENVETKETVWANNVFEIKRTQHEIYPPTQTENINPINHAMPESPINTNSTTPSADSTTPAYRINGETYVSTDDYDFDISNK